MWNALSERLENLLPASLRGGMHETARRARRLVWLTAGVVPLHLLAATLSALIRGPNHLAGILLAGGVVGAFAPALLHISGSVRPAATWFLAVNLAAVSAVAWTGYGPLSPACQALVLFPVVGMVLGGARLAVPFAAISISQILLLVVAQRSGFVFPLEASGPDFIATHIMVMSGALIIVVAFLSSYDTAWRTASARSLAAQAELAAANDAKSEFLATVSHELRTPLNAVIGYTELLLEDAVEAERIDLQRIEIAGRHLLELVDGMLDLARIEAGRLELSLETVDLSELSNRVLDEVRPFADKHGAVLVNEVDDALATRADRLRVRQVLLNLLSNACKFADEGTVTLRGRRVRRRIRLEVQDDGVGMNADELARIFEPYEQGAAGISRGTGLGLAISRRLCEAMGGTLTAESTPGVGTCFRMELPLKGW